MDEKQKIRLEELRWQKEREEKLKQLDQKLKEVMPVSAYSFVAFDESDKIQELSEGWPSEKWEKHLYLQTETSQPGIVTKVITKFIEINPSDFCYIFFMNYNFGLIKISNDFLLTKWPAFIEVDGDEIFCFMPNRNSWICVERTEEFMEGKEHLGAIWIYEITFSNLKLKNELSIDDA